MQSNASPKVTLEDDASRTIAEVAVFKSIVSPHPTYVLELRRRVERGPGATLVAKQAKMSRQTVWRMFTSPEESTVEAADRVKQALAELEPHADHDQLPPVAIAIIDRADHDAIVQLRALRERDPDTVAAIVAELATATGKRPRKR
jgi:DNA-binding phage protein